MSVMPLLRICCRSTWYTGVMTDERHPGTEHLLQFFTYEHLPEDLQLYSKPFADTAWYMAGCLPDGPELTAGLRKLLEAKDCCVRAATLTRHQQ